MSLLPLGTVSPCMMFLSPGYGGLSSKGLLFVLLILICSLSNGVDLFLVKSNLGGPSSSLSPGNSS